MRAREQGHGLFEIACPEGCNALVRDAACNARLITALGPSQADLLEYLGGTLMVARMVHEDGEVGPGVHGFAN